MSALAASPGKVVVVAVSVFGLISCGGSRSVKLRDVGRSPHVGTTIVTSARMNAPRSAPATVRSCNGPSLCREDELTAGLDAIVEIEQACARLGGTVAPDRCPRAEAAARCSGVSEHGTLAVYAYARSADSADVIARVADQCEALEGTFEALSTRLP